MEKGNMVEQYTRYSNSQRILCREVLYCISFIIFPRKILIEKITRSILFSHNNRVYLALSQLVILSGRVITAR